MSSADNRVAPQAVSHQLIDKYGCKCDPFDLPESFFFQGAQRQHNLDTLQHLLSFGDMVLLLTGDRGSGKTTLLNRLLSQISGHLTSVVIDGARVPTSIHLKQLIAKKTSTHVAPTASFQEIFRSFESAYPGQRLCLVIDDAQNLSAELAHDLIAAFRKQFEKTGAPVSLLLAGTQDVMALFSHEGVDPQKASWIYQIPLKPLSQDELFTYLQLRFFRAGAASGFELTAQQLQILSEKAKGNFGRVNKLAPAVLLDVFGAQGKVRQYRQAWLKFGLAVSATLLASFMIIGLLYGLFDGPVEGGATSADDSSNQGVISESKNVAQIERKRLEISIPQTPKLPLVPDESGVKKALENDVVAERSFVVDEAVKPEVDGEPMDKSAPKMVLEPLLSPLPDMEVKPVQMKKDKPDLALSKAPVTKVETVSEAVLSDVDVSTNAASNPELRWERGRDWLSKQSRQAFTIQLLGSRNKETAIKFLELEPNDKLFYVETLYKGKVWYVVFHGVYASKTEAREALKGLSASMQKQKPWPRSIQGVLESLPES